LDTCHSGAIQPPRTRNLTAAVRQLQDDVIFTVTASRGDQLAAESPTWKHGVFTQCLLDALEGKAERQPDGRNLLDEAIKYLQETVPKVAQQLTGGAQSQHPTAAPDELLPFVRLPLTQTERR